MTKRSPTIDDQRSTWFTMKDRVAFHEAGHAVIARQLGISVSSVTTRRRGNILGCVRLATCKKSEFGPLLHTELEWRERYTPELVFEPMEPRREVYLAHILVALAGAAAEKLFCGGVVHYGARSDNADVRWLIRRCPCDRTTMKRTAETLVQCHRDAILRVACHLTVPTTLTGKQLDEAINGPDF